jgi:hypothetical protein
MYKNTCTPVLLKSNPYSRPKRSIIEDYGLWLNSQSWDYYGTFTTRQSLTLTGARRSMERLYRLLAADYNSDPKIFWVAEPFDTKYGCHLHALLKLPNNHTSLKTKIKDAWQVVSYGKGKKEYNNTTIKVYDKKKGAHFYIAKYLHRDDADYDIL